MQVSFWPDLETNSPTRKTHALPIRPPHPVYANYDESYLTMVSVNQLNYLFIGSVNDPLNIYL